MIFVINKIYHYIKKIGMLMIAYKIRGGRYSPKVGYCSISSRNGFSNHIQASHKSDYQSRNQLQMNKIQGEMVHPYLLS